MKEHWTGEGEHCCELELAWEAFLESARVFSGLNLSFGRLLSLNTEGTKVSVVLCCFVHKAASLI